MVWQASDISVITTGTDPAPGASVSTAPFALKPNRLYLVWIGITEADGDPYHPTGITHGGLVFIEKFNRIMSNAGFKGGGSLWWAVSGGATASIAMTISLSGNLPDTLTWSVLEIAHADLSAPLGVSATAQSATSVSLPAFTSLRSMTLGFWTNRENVVVAPASALFTEIVDLIETIGGDNHQQVQYSLAPRTTISWTTAATGSLSVVGGVEVRREVAGGQGARRSPRYGLTRLARR